MSTVYVALADGDRFVLLAHHGLPKNVAARGELPAGSSLLVRSLEEREPTLIDDLAAHDDLRHIVERSELGLRALVIVPLSLTDGEVIGAMCAGQRESHAWTSEDAAIFKDLGSAATLILRHRDAIHASGAVSAGIGKLSLRGRALTEQVRRLNALVSDDDDPRVRTFAALAAARVHEVEGTLRDLEAMTGTNALPEAPGSVTTDLSAVVYRSVGQALGVEADGADVRVDVEAATARCDPLEIERSLTTLLISLRGFAAGTDGINVRVFESGSNVHIDIVDLGQGIPAAEVARLVANFKPSARAPVSSLQLVDGAVLADSGTITAESSWRGTSFHITLPSA
jgi:signal transduction histidine kinase